MTIERFGIARVLAKTSGLAGGLLLFESGFFQSAEQKGGEKTDGFGGSKVYFSAAELVDGLGQQLGDWLDVLFSGKKEEGGEITAGVGGAEGDFSAREVFLGLKGQLD